ncbi:MAG: UDP-2,4-diacetamido-2,4,6-trideoxy-beta-L-altropyranose hydrolase [Pseudomonadota bacterium]
MTAPPRVGFRVDSSTTVGAGHAMRCLTLAEYLRRAGSEVTFATRKGVGDAIDLISVRGFAVHGLSLAATGWQTDAVASLCALRSLAPLDWLVVDHYGLDYRWETRMREVARRILVLDDLANRQHDCEALLDQNYYCNADARYREIVPAGCQLFLGPAFALLRDEFRSGSDQNRVRDGNVTRLFVSFGAMDPTDETRKVLEALRTLPNFVIDVVVGAANPQRDRVIAECASLPSANCHVQTSRIAELMHTADLALGAGGSTMWERCVVGLPTITTVTASNQLQTTEDLAKAGAIWYLGQADQLDAEDYRSAIEAALKSPDRLMQISARGLAIMEPTRRALSAGRHAVVDAMLNALSHPRTEATH